MLGVTLPLVLFLLYLFSNRDDTKCCCLMWSVIFSYDLIIGNIFYRDVGFFLFAALIDSLLITTILLVKQRSKKIILLIILGISLYLNLQEHFSYFKTWAYPFIVHYQWISVELMLITLLWDKNNVQIRRNNY